MQFDHCEGQAGKKASSCRTLSSASRETKAARRRIRDLVRKYVSRIQDLNKFPVPMHVCEYAQGKWDYRDAAKLFHHETGHSLASASRFFQRVHNKADADYWEITPRIWMIYFVPKPCLPK